MHRVRYCIFIRFFFRFVFIFELFVVVILLCCFGLQHNNDSVCIFYDRFDSRIGILCVYCETLYNVNEAKLFVIHEMDIFLFFSVCFLFRLWFLLINNFEAITLFFFRQCSHVTMTNCNLKWKEIFYENEL